MTKTIVKKIVNKKAWIKAGESFKEINVKSKKMKGLSVVLEWIGEGRSGDFDKEDKEDEPLLRFSVSYKDEEVDDSSYCTQLKAYDDRKLLRQAIKAVLKEAEDSYSDGRFHFKKRGEFMSWLEIENGKLN